MRVALVALAACGHRTAPPDVRSVDAMFEITSGAALYSHNPEIDRVRDMPVPPKYSGRQSGIGVMGEAMVLVTCNDPQAHAFGMFRCASSFLVVHGATVELFFGDDAAWHLTTDIIAMYAHARSLGPALAKQGQWTEFVGLAPYDIAVDPCDACEGNNPTSSADCYRAVVNDERAKRLWFIPCRGEPHWERQ